jgi:DNA-binding transcriptional ArsR family regulator
MNETTTLSNSSATTIKEAKATASLNTEKWGEALNEGFILTPSVLFKQQAALGLENGEVMVLMNMLMSWWEIDDLPYIQTSTIAKRMGVTRRTVQRHIERLEDKHLIRRIWGTSRSNDQRAGASYDLRGVVTILKDRGRVGHPARMNSLAAEQESHQGQKNHG